MNQWTRYFLQTKSLLGWLVVHKGNSKQKRLRALTSRGRAQHKCASNAPYIRMKAICCSWANFSCDVNNISTTTCGSLCCAAQCRLWTSSTHTYTQTCIIVCWRLCSLLQVQCVSNVRSHTDTWRTTLLTYATHFVRLCICVCVCALQVQITELNLHWTVYPQDSPMNIFTKLPCVVCMYAMLLTWVLVWTLNSCWRYSCDEGVGKLFELCIQNSDIGMSDYFLVW